MRTESFIGLDIHSSFTEMAVVNTSGQITARTRCDTPIPDIVEVLGSVRRPRSLTLEEGPLAGWLAIRGATTGSPRTTTSMPRSWRICCAAVFSRRFTRTIRGVVALFGEPDISHRDERAAEFLGWP